MVDIVVRMDKGMKRKESFDKLSTEQKLLIRSKQEAAKARKQERKAEKKLKQKLKQEKESHEGSEFPRSISRFEYFRACPFGLFYDPNLKAEQDSVFLLLYLLTVDDAVSITKGGTPCKFSQFNYFLLNGTYEERWDPRLYVRFAYEGFFIITTEDFDLKDTSDHPSRESHKRRIPLPELQPYYSVILWHDFNQSKYVKKALRKLKQEFVNNECYSNSNAPSMYRLFHSSNIELLFQKVDAYQKERNGTNWLTKKYIETLQLANDDQELNFSFHTFEYYHTRTEKLIAGEIGYSIGKIYTSLSGYSDRDFPGCGIAQLALLGKWLQKKDFMVWSLGHCYSPEMEYKRRLGHRIFPRKAFLNITRKYRGEFLTTENITESQQRPFQLNEECDICCILGI